MFYSLRYGTFVRSNSHLTNVGVTTQEVKESLSSEDVQAVIQETKELKERQVSGEWWPCFLALLP